MNGMTLGDILQQFENEKLDENEFVANVDEFLENALSELTKMAESQPEVAYERLNQTLSMLSFFSVKRGVQKVQNSLNRWLPKLRIPVQVIAKKMNAKSYSIAVGIPWGVQVRIQWDV